MKRRNKGHYLARLSHRLTYGPCVLGPEPTGVDEFDPDTARSYRDLSLPRELPNPRRGLPKAGHVGIPVTQGRRLTMKLTISGAVLMRLAEQAKRLRRKG